MTEREARRIRKRLTVELDAKDEALVQRVRVLAVQQRLTLREAVLLALVEWVGNAR